MSTRRSTGAQVCGEQRHAREAEVYLGMCKRWRELPKPTIAKVQGACIAGGLMLAWVCNIIVAFDDAFFMDPVVRMGLPGVEFFAHPWVVGPRAAKEFLFTGGQMTAQRAHELGMVNQVVARDELDIAVIDLAARIAKMPRFGLHHLAHAHNAEVCGDSLAGHDARSMRDSFS